MTETSPRPSGTGPSLPAWRQDLAAALHRNRADPGSRYLQLATVRADGVPANRTLVFRGFEAHSGALYMVSDERSAKPAELRAEPRAAIAWYFSKTREQFRLTGTVTCVLPTDGAAALADCQRKWNSLSPAARSQYFWPEPGTPLAAQAPPTGQPPIEAPPPWFLVLTMAVTEVDHLDLRPSPQRRRHYLLQDGAWQAAEINP